MGPLFKSTVARDKVSPHHKIITLKVIIIIIIIIIIIKL
jgi:hypothetical protein